MGSYGVSSRCVSRGETITATGPVLFLKRLLGGESPRQYQIMGAITGGSHFRAGGTTTVPVIVQAAASQTANLEEWQDSDGEVIARVAIGGGIVAAAENAGLSAETGGYLYLSKSSVAAANPGSDKLRLYVRDGTNPGTLKLVVRGGTSGAETTVVDNIGQT